MNNLIVDASTGDVGVASLMKTARPSLNQKDILSKVKGILQNYQGPKISKRQVQGRITSVVPFEACEYILDNISGRGWDTWRDTSGARFKQSLKNHVDRVCESFRAQQARHQCSDQTSRAETKTSILAKAFTAVGIHGSVRIDESSGKGSIIDVNRMLCPNASAEYAAQMLTRVLEKEKRDGADRRVHNAHHPTPISERIEYIKINGKGHITPVCDAQTLVEIIWLLPSSAAKEFRRQSARTITRVLGGDTTLCDEIEQRCERLQSTEEGRAYQNFVLDQTPAKRHRSEAPFWFELASAEQKRAYVSVMANNEMALEQMELCKTFKNELQSVGQFSGRDRVEFADRMKDIQVRALAAGNMLAAGPSADNSIVAVARPVDDSIDPETGLLIATPKCSESVRGPETSICNEATKMGVKLGDRAGQVGKVVKRLYSERYGAQAATDIPKRDTTFRGKPFSENTYWSRDADIIQEAIWAVRGREEDVPPHQKIDQTLFAFFPSAGQQPGSQTCDMET